MSDLTPHILNLLLILTIVLPVFYAACKDGCLCEDDFCTTCNDVGHNGTSHCKKCPSECRSCFPDKIMSSSKCKECINGYYLSYGSCYKCQQNSLCKCKKGYYPTKFSEWCNSCPAYCYNCSSRSLCNNCHESCLCPANCLACTPFFYCRSCRSGYYGESCEHTCSEGCTDYTCNRKSGHCSCKNGWHGELCNKSCPVNCKVCSNDGLCFECEPGYYGTVCERRCSNGCQDSLCNQNTAECIHQPCRKRYVGSKCDYCNFGYFGEYCLECPNNCLICSSNTSCTLCNTTFFGATCERRCPDRCRYNECFSKNGECFGCRENFTGKWCENCLLNGSVCNHNCPSNCLACLSKNYCFKCKSKYYGDTCQLFCPPGCWNDGCDKVNGHCEYSLTEQTRCKTGFEGFFCQKCVKGKYGITCSDDCPFTCAGNVCEKSTGNCLHGCISATFGLRCEHHCPDNCNQCISNISCDLCDSGYWGDLCEFNCSDGCLENCSDYGMCIDCKEGYYGTFCNVSCPENCISRQCNVTGSCLGCADGFFGDGCEQTCSTDCCNGTCYEDGSCELCIKVSCPSHCFRGRCSDSGLCLDCVDGLFGTYCEQTCSLDCCNGTCYRNGSCELCTKVSCPEHCLRERCSDTGACLECIDGFFGGRCEQTCFPGCCNGTCYRNGSCTLCNNVFNGKEIGYSPEKLVWFVITGVLAFSTLVLTVSLLNRREPANDDSSMNIYSDINNVLLDEGSDGDEGNNEKGKDNISIHASCDPYESPLNEEPFTIGNHENGNDNLTLHVKHGSYVQTLNEEAFGMVSDEVDEVISSSVCSESCEKQSGDYESENYSANATENDTYLTPVN